MKYLLDAIMIALAVLIGWGGLHSMLPTVFVTAYAVTFVCYAIVRNIPPKRIDYSKQPGTSGPSLRRRPF
jgi:hypothetical protein